MFLCGASFHAAPNEMAHTLNFWSISSLSLLNCPNSLGLLEAIIATEQKLKLKKFEFYIEGGEHFNRSDTEPGIVTGFLNTFKGLEDLYLTLAVYDEESRCEIDVDWKMVAQGILNHSSTLKQLVLNGPVHDLQRSPGGSRTYNSLVTVLESTRLECLGMGNYVGFLVRIILSSLIVLYSARW